jgi:hypothetical protein
VTMDLYIYYRVRCEHAQLLQSKAVAMQRSIAEEYGVVTELKRRPEEKDGEHTWMEVYSAVPQGFEATIERAVTQAGLAAVIEGQRHTEYFLDCSTCA